MRFKKGDKVRVTSNGGVYTTYLRWLCEHCTDIAEELPHWVYNRSLPENEYDNEWTVVCSGKHLDTGVMLVFIDNGKESYIIEEKCLVPYEEDSDQEVRDVLRRLVTLFEENEDLFKKVKEIVESV